MSANKTKAYDAMLEALIQARDELRRINELHKLDAQNCVLPDVSFVVTQAILRGQDYALSA
jgi:hypothetical protein